MQYSILPAASTSCGVALHHNPDRLRTTIMLLERSIFKYGYPCSDISSIRCRPTKGTTRCSRLETSHYHDFYFGGDLDYVVYRLVIELVTRARILTGTYGSGSGLLPLRC